MIRNVGLKKKILEKKMIFQTNMIMFHINLEGCTCISWVISFMPSSLRSCPAHFLKITWHWQILWKENSPRLENNTNTSSKRKSSFLCKLYHIWTKKPRAVLGKPCPPNKMLGFTNHGNGNHQLSRPTERLTTWTSRKLRLGPRVSTQRMTPKKHQWL